MKSIIYIVLLISLFVSCSNESPILNPSLKVTGDSLCRINPIKYKTDGTEVSTNLPGNVGFSYRVYNTMVGTQIVTTNDSLAGIIKLELLNHGVSFEDNGIDMCWAYLHSIEYGQWYLPKYWLNQQEKRDTVYLPCMHIIKPVHLLGDGYTVYVIKKVPCIEYPLVTAIAVVIELEKKEKR